MNDRYGLSFVEIVFACVLLLLLLVPLGLLLTRASRETRTSMDEFYGALYLTELMDQAASLPYEALPVASAPRSLTTTDDTTLDPSNPMTKLHLTTLRANFLDRTLQVTVPPDADDLLKELRGTVTYRRTDGKEHSLAMVTMVGRSARTIKGAP